MKIVIVTDAWEPQVNGVVRTLKQTSKNLRLMGHEVSMITPNDYFTVPCPSYPSIRIALFPGSKIKQRLNSIAPDAVHIATEGTLGSAARRWCIRNNIRFTSSFHTQFPEYIRLRLPIPLSWTYAWLRNFHKKAVHTLVPTESQKQRLEKWGFDNVRVWGRGVDTSIFRPESAHFYNLPGPIYINMGRVAVEKNIEAFLDLELEGSKVVIGDGPDLEMLKQRYPQVLFTGAKFGHELASFLAGGDVFVFPSKTDTFGLVILEALACGLPVAAFPVTGPKDILKNGVTGYMDENLQLAAKQALKIKPKQCIEFAQKHSWYACSKTFEQSMHNNHQRMMDNSIIHPTFWSL